ncbi:MAG: hypothetical protein CML47_05685 [Rhodobacteraceae bacterium]|jgi:hypothetical protein|nr:MAG: hypothetical protein CML47_05685 [Paracoccaceae bacterium]|tara:strand:- start:656 stop:901 length:246 start_codon:yes stop_codon:yes gene_type:complete
MDDNLQERIRIANGLLSDIYKLNKDLASASAAQSKLVQSYLEDNKSNLSDKNISIEKLDRLIENMTILITFIKECAVLSSK